MSSRSRLVLLSVLLVLGVTMPSGCFLTTVPGGSTGGSNNTGNTGGTGSFGGGGGTISGGTTTDCRSLGTPSDPIHQSGLDEINAYRRSLGLSELEYSLTLEAAADAHARDMWDRSFYDSVDPHTNPDGDGPSERAVAAGFCHRFVGENIAWGMNAMTSVAEAMAGWKNSPDHDQNMRTADFKYFGFGYYQVQDGANQYYLWVQLFAYDN